MQCQDRWYRDRICQMKLVWLEAAGMHALLKVVEVPNKMCRLWQLVLASSSWTTDFVIYLQASSWQSSLHMPRDQTDQGCCMCPFTGRSEVLACNPEFECSGHLARLGSLVWVFGVVLCLSMYLPTYLPIYLFIYFNCNIVMVHYNLTYSNI